MGDMVDFKITALLDVRQKERTALPFAEGKFLVLGVQQISTHCIKDEPDIIKKALFLD